MLKNHLPPPVQAARCAAKSTATTVMLSADSRWKASSLSALLARSSLAAADGESAAARATSLERKAAAASLLRASQRPSVARRAKRGARTLARSKWRTSGSAVISLWSFSG